MRAEARLAWQVEVFGDPHDALRLIELRPDPLGAGEIRVAVAANGLNALDVSICKGTHPLRPEPPFVLGAELVGVVTETGRGVERVRPGERVLGMNPKAYGCFRAEVCLPEHAILPLPDEVPDCDAAALLVTYQAAYTALVRRAKLTPGEWVLVSGAAGALGSAVTQLATALGGRVIATASSDERRGVCRGLGAVAALDAASDTIVADLLDVTAGHGVDVICDLVGGSFLSAVVQAAAFEGRLLSCGWVSGSVPHCDVSTLVVRNLTVGGVSWGASYPNLAPDSVREAHAELLRLYMEGELRPFIGQRGSYRDLRQLLADNDERRTIGKSVMEWTV